MADLAGALLSSLKLEQVGPTRPGRATQFSLLPSLAAGAVDDLWKIVRGLLDDSVTFEIQVTWSMRLLQPPTAANDFALDDSIDVVLAETRISSNEPGIAPEVNPFALVTFLAPRLTSDGVAATHYDIVARVVATVDKVTVNQEHVLPVAVPAVQVPGLAVLCARPLSATDFPGDVSIIVRAGAPEGVDQLLKTLNQVQEALMTILGLVGLAGGSLLDVKSTLATTVLEPLAEFIGRVRLGNGTYLWVGDCPHLSMVGEMDDESEALFALLPPNVKIRIHKHQEFNGHHHDFTGDDILTAFVDAATASIASGAGVNQTLGQQLTALLRTLLLPGFRIVRVPDLEKFKYKPGSDDLKDDFESLSFRPV